jgi:hypothetical protein
MNERHIVIDDIITIKIKNVIIQYNDEKYSITLTAYIDNISDEPIELYYYWTLDNNLDILETTYFRYHIKKTKLNWYIIDETLSNIMINEINSDIVSNEFNAMNI